MRKICCILCQLWIWLSLPVFPYIPNCAWLIGCFSKKFFHDERVNIISIDQRKGGANSIYRLFGIFTVWFSHGDNLNIKADDEESAANDALIAVFPDSQKHNSLQHHKRNWILTLGMVIWPGEFNHMQNGNRLLGIKAIADYLNISERNVYRWENELGLPLRRVAGSKGRRAYVDLDELEGWMRNQFLSLS